MSTILPRYDDAYYRDYDGQRYERNDTWMAFFHAVGDRIVATLDPATSLDAGCAIGMLVEALHDHGVDAHGVDVSDAAISHVPEHLSDRVRVGSLTEPIEGRYDLVTCIEVIEHLPAVEAPIAIANLCSVTDAVLLSSTPEEHEEPTHLNVQPPEYWSAHFAAQGFLRDTNYDASFISPWAVLYRRSADMKASEIVRTYDRAWWRLRDENTRLRTALITTTDEKHILTSLLNDDELDSVTSAADPLEALRRLVGMLASERGESGRYGSTDADLMEARNDALILRDQLIGYQQHTVQLEDKVRELESVVEAFVALKSQADSAEENYRAVVGSGTWRVGRKVTAPYRYLRDRFAKRVG